MAIKKINYNGSSKVIIRLCEVVNDLIDRGGGGHTIQNSSGTDMTARTNLQFTGASVSDDAGNDRTVVAVPTDVSAFNNDAGYLDSSDVSAVAISGDYDDLLNKPTIPSAQVNSDWNAVSGVAEILNKPSLATVATSGLYSDLSGTPSLATVATSGSYNDLSNKPTIPTVNDATLTLTQGGSTLGTFTANASSNVTIDVPSAGSPSASSVSYNNTSSGMTATNVQDAIDELCTDVSGKVSKSGDTMSGNLTIDRQDGSQMIGGQSILTIGNNLGIDQDKNSEGLVYLYSMTGKKTVLTSTADGSDKIIEFPNKGGTVALTSDLPSDSGWKLCTPVNGNYMAYRKIGNLVFVSRHTIGTIAANTNTVVGNLPSGYRPSFNFYSGAPNEYIIIYTNGDISIKSPTANFMDAWYVSFIADA